MGWAAGAQWGGSGGAWRWGLPEDDCALCPFMLQARQAIASERPFHALLGNDGEVASASTGCASHKRFPPLLRYTA